MSTTTSKKGSKGTIRANSKTKALTSKKSKMKKSSHGSKKHSSSAKYNVGDSVAGASSMTTAQPDGYVEVPYNAASAYSSPQTAYSGAPAYSTAQYSAAPYAAYPPPNNNKNTYTKTIIISVGIIVVLIVIIVVACCVAKKSEGFNEFNNEAIMRHNYYRQLHHTSPLQLDQDLVKAAQNWANQMASTLVVQQEPNQIYGENVVKLNPEINRIPNGNDITEIFYSTHDKYNYKNPNPKCCSQFTQMIWRSTTNMGCAYNMSLGPLYVSCKYYQPGNIIGQFFANVKKDY